MNNKLAKVFTNKLTESGIIKYITRFDSYTEGTNESFFTARLSGKHTIKFSVDIYGDVFLIPMGKFKLLIDDGKELAKMLNDGMESLHNKTKPDRFYLSMFRFMVSIARFIDNNNEGYSIPHNQSVYLKSDFNKLMSRLDGYGKTKIYRDIINRGNIKYVF